MSTAVTESTMTAESFLIFCALFIWARWPVTTTTVSSDLAAGASCAKAGADKAIMPRATTDAPPINTRPRVFLEFFTLLSLSKKRRPRQGGDMV